MVWCSVRCLFRCPDGLYEERITVWDADSLEDAIAMAEHEAAEYVDAMDFEYLGLAQGFRMADELEPGAEVFSLLRESDLEPAAYLDAFFDTGSERETRT